MPYEVTGSGVPPRLTAVVRSTIAWTELPVAIHDGLEEVYRFLQGTDVTQTGHNIVLYLDAKPTIEVGVEVSGTFEATSTVLPSSLPGGDIATTTHLGAYAGLSAAHAAVRKWCLERGRTLAGPSWEIYGDWRDDLEALRTDVFHLLE